VPLNRRAAAAELRMKPYAPGRRTAGAGAAVLAERELAISLAGMVMSTPPYRPAPARYGGVGATPLLE
jgi:hypothetical protein